MVLWIWIAAYLVTRVILGLAEIKCVPLADLIRVSYAMLDQRSSCYLILHVSSMPRHET